MDKKESEIIDVFGKYADEVLSITGIYESRTNAIKFDNLKKAIDSGDLFLKSDIERAKLESKIELLKNTVDFLNDTCPYGKFLPLHYVESEITELEKQLQEMK